MTIAAVTPALPGSSVLPALVPSLGMATVTTAEVIPGIVLQKGESPVWSGVDNLLYFVDIDGKSIHSYDPATGSHEKLSMSTMVASVIPTEKPGILVAAREQDIVLVSMDSNSPGGCGIKDTLSCVPREHGAAENGWRFNDCRATPGGQLIAGRLNLRTYKGGWVYMIPSPVTGPKSWANPEVLLQAGILDLPNGMVWHMATRRVWYNDTAACKIYVFDCDEMGTPVASTRSTFLQFEDGEGEPDGMTIDAQGNLWLALHAAGRVICVHPESGKTLHTILLPVKSVSACNWGGPGLRTLFITTISNDVENPEPLAGALFKAEIEGVHGARPAYPFIC